VTFELDGHRRGGARAHRALLARARIFSSPAAATRNSQRVMSSSSITAEPFSPQISMRRANPATSAVLASMVPNAPLPNFSAATAVSSDSILCTRCVVHANTSTGMPANHCSRSTPWIAWLMTAPPPSSESLPFQPV
jgi:hypothetical protein